MVGGINHGKLEWKEVTRTAVINILHNPAYAGAFVYGRRQSNPHKKKEGQFYSGIERKEIDEWISLVKDKYPAYISWTKFIANQNKIKDNYNCYKEKIRKGIERKRKALLQGIIFCGRCGRKMRVLYKNSHRYFCNSMNSDYGKPMCFSLHGSSIDKSVTEAFFEAIEPSNLDLLEELLNKKENEKERIIENWKQRIMRAEYEEKVARKRYKNVDPENRLVARVCPNI